MLATVELPYPDPTLYAIPFFVVTLLAEVWVLARWRRAGRAVVGYATRDTLASLAMGLGSVFIVGAINFGIFALATFLSRWRVADLGEGWLGWAVALVGWDFAFRARGRAGRLWAHDEHLELPPARDRLPRVRGDRARPPRRARAARAHRHPLARSGVAAPELDPALVGGHLTGGHAARRRSRATSGDELSVGARAVAARDVRLCSPPS